MKVAWLVLLGITTATPVGCATSAGEMDVVDPDSAPVAEVQTDPTAAPATAVPSTNPTVPIATAPPATAPAAASPSPVVQAILQSPDPSTAVEAYARAIAAQPKRIEAESAYLQRMVQFGVPAMAESQAQDLILRQPDNALAWSVAAYVSGRRGDTNAALGQIATAVKLNRDDVFVQRTAGQLLAWYDAHPDAPKPPEAITHDLTPLRAAMANRPAFDTAYRDAREEYRVAEADDNANVANAQV